MTKSSLRSKGFVSSYNSSCYITSLIEVRAETQTGTRRQELKQRPWKSATYCLALHGLFCFFIHPRSTCPEVAPSTMDWGLPHQSLIKKMLHRLPTAQSYGDSLSIVVPSSQITLTNKSSQEKSLIYLN